MTQGGLRGSVERATVAKEANEKMRTQMKKLRTRWQGHEEQKNLFIHFHYQ